MTAATIIIGNSDDKLSQAKWSRLIMHVRHLVYRCGDMQFDGQPAGDSAFQNACFVISNVTPQHLKQLRQGLRLIAAKFEQDTIALISAETEFLLADRTSPTKTAIAKTIANSFPIRLNVTPVYWPHCDQWWQLDCCMQFTLEKG